MVEMGECCVHPGVEAIRTCNVCGKEYCSICFITPEDQVCKFCKNRTASANSTVMGGQTSNTVNQSTTSQTALIALILSIVGTVSCWCCFGIFNIVSLVLAIVAKNELKKNPGMQGEGMATAALWISIIGLILMVLLTIFGMLFGILEPYIDSYMKK